MERVRLNEDGTRTVMHGAYEEDTTHDVVCHWYAACGEDDGPAYFEILEVRDPPPERHPFLFHAYYGHGKLGSSAFGFATLAAAESGRDEFFDRHARRLSNPAYVPQLAGCLSAERLGDTLPWVYDVKRAG